MQTQQTYHFSGQNPSVSTPQKAFKKAHVIVVGNEKGGSGKTTTTMHLIIALLRLGFSVGTMDLDSRQRSLTRYVENRRQTVAREGISLPIPEHIVINRSPFNSVEEAKKDERERFAQGLSKIYATADFVVIDTPGSDTYMSRLAHSFADTVITPINDSFVDLDVLASVDGRTLAILKPSIYSEMLWEQKLQRAKRDGGSIDWIVMRNRLSNIDARNKRFMTKVTEELARRIGFRVSPGFSERVIFREMFLQGLTVLDVMEANTNVSVSMSHIAARQEVRDLLNMLKLDEVNKRMQVVREKEEGAAAKDEDEAEAPVPEPIEAKKAPEAPVLEPVVAKTPEAAKVEEKPVETPKPLAGPSEAPKPEMPKSETVTAVSPPAASTPAPVPQSSPVAAGTSTFTATPSSPAATPSSAAVAPKVELPKPVAREEEPLELTEEIKGDTKVEAKKEQPREMAASPSVPHKKPSDETTSEGKPADSKPAQPRSPDSFLISDDDHTLHFGAKKHEDA